MRQRVISLGFVVVGGLAGPVGCAGADEPDDTSVSPNPSGSGTTTSTTSTATVGPTSSAATSTTTGATGTSTGATGTSTGATGTSTGATGTSTGATGATSEEPAGPSFATDIHPIFTAKCSGGSLCHGDGEAMAKYGSATLATSWGVTKVNVETINRRIQAGEMPVDSSIVAICKKTGGGADAASTNAKCLTAAELTLVQTWAAAGGPE